MRYIIATLGCKVNQYESEAMEQLLQSRGHSRCGEGETPDVLIVNTCAVTAEGARKARQTARRLQRQYPGALLALCGCWSQVERDAARELEPAVLFGTGDRRGFVEAAEAAVRDRTAPAEVFDDPFRRREFEELPPGAYEGHARAYLKIQDGCDNFCSYCVIPYARGRVRSLPADRCAAQAAELAEKGYREIVVTGIEAASWGKDLKTGEGLIDAMEAIGAAVPEVRLHLGSLEPTVVTDDFVSRLSELNVCSHFHLSLQSGCDATLKRMRRKYDTAEFFKVTEHLRAAFPGCSLTTDLICGFPGETEAEFAETLGFIERCAFAAMHIFPYSVRPGTKAADMSGQVDKKTKAERCRAAQAVAGQMRRAFLDAQIGQVRQVLFETQSVPGLWLGHTENYLETRAAGEALRGLVKKVKITGVRGEILVGAVL